MDVTRRNFVEALAILKSLLPTAAFVSVDLEFTGLGENKPSHLDTPSIRYETARADSETFPPIQFGLSIFRLVPDKKPSSRQPPSPFSDADRIHNDPPTPPVAPGDGNDATPLSPRQTRTSNWEAATFNFNIFPHAVYYPSNTRYPYYDRIVQMQSSSVHFLMQHGFDFSKLFAHGISWVRENTEEDLRSHITKILRKKFNPPTRGKIEMSAENKKILEFYREAIGEWVRTVSKEDAGMKEPGETSEPIIKMFSMPKTPPQRRLVFDLVRDEFPRIYASSMATQERTQLKLELYASGADVAAKTECIVLREVEEELSKSVGFRYVIDLLRESKLPIVIHNGLMDIAKLYGNFISPMPTQLDEFKEQASAAFPSMYDTRWMLQHICDNNKVVRRTINTHKARSMDEVIRTLRPLLRKTRSGHAPQIRTLVPNESVKWASNHINEGVVSYEEGFSAFNEKGSPNAHDGDKYGFSRYSSEGEGEFGHEAGFDALETGRLFIILLHLKEIEWTGCGLDLSCAELASSRNKIYLGSCGGFHYIDLLTRSEPEKNPYLELGNAVVITGDFKDEKEDNESMTPHQRRGRLLKRITAGAGCTTEKSMTISATHNTILVVLNRSTAGQTAPTGKRKDMEDINYGKEIQAVIQNGQEIGIKVVSYADALASQTSGDYDELKKRRYV